jgi:hypothetical protein
VGRGDILPVWEEFEPGEKAGDDFCVEKNKIFGRVA